MPPMGWPPGTAAAACMAAKPASDGGKRENRGLHIAREKYINPMIVSQFVRALPTGDTEWTFSTTQGNALGDFLCAICNIVAEVCQLFR